MSDTDRDVYDIDSVYKEENEDIEVEEGVEKLNINLDDLIDQVQNEQDDFVHDKDYSPNANPPSPIEISSDETPDLPDRDPIIDYLKVDSPIHFQPAEIENSSNYLLDTNLKKIKLTFETSGDRKSIEQGTNTLKSLFNQIKNASMINSQNAVDWDQWEKLINDELTINQIQKLVNKGIPNEIRGIIWGIVSKSNNIKLNDYFYNNKNLESIHERQIKKDITRTSFYNSISRLDKANELFNILKIYSNYDKEIGYTQGMIFLLTPITLQLNEFESFNLFVSLMYAYNLRSLFQQDMKGLHLMLYKFDRLLEVCNPKLFNHLINQGIKSSMYASQWFLTLFSYKFPINIIYRVYDHVVFEGSDFLIKLSIHLMMMNEANLLNLKFDKLLDFLKHLMFNNFINEKYIESPTAPNTPISPISKVSTDKQLTDYYDVNKIFKNLINVNPNDLTRFTLEFNQLYDSNLEKAEQVNKVNLVNGKLRNEIKYLQMSLSSLNQDHLNLLQNLINLKIRLPELVSSNSELSDDINNLEADIEVLLSKVNGDVPENIEVEIAKLLEENKLATEKNINLEDEYDELQAKELELDDKLAPYKKKWFWN